MDDPSHSSTKTKRATVGFDRSASGTSSAAAAAAAASVDRGGADRSVGRSLGAALFRASDRRKRCTEEFLRRWAQRCRGKFNFESLSDQMLED